MSEEKEDRSNYSADNIQVLEGLEAVRKRPPCILVISALKASIILFMK